MAAKFRIYLKTREVTLYQTDPPTSIILTPAGYQYTGHTGPILQVFDSDAGRFYKHRGVYWRMTTYKEIRR